MRLPRTLGTNLRIGLVYNREFIVLGKISAPCHSKIGRTGGHSHHISIDKIIQVNIQYLLAEIVLY